MVPPSSPRTAPVRPESPKVPGSESRQTIRARFVLCFACYAIWYVAFVLALYEGLRLCNEAFGNVSQLVGDHPVLMQIVMGVKAGVVPAVSEVVVKFVLGLVIILGALLAVDASSDWMNKVFPGVGVRAASTLLLFVAPLLFAGRLKGGDE